MGSGGSKKDPEPPKSTKTSTVVTTSKSDKSSTIQKQNSRNEIQYPNNNRTQFDNNQSYGNNNEKITLHTQPAPKKRNEIDSEINLGSEWTPKPQHRDVYPTPTPRTSREGASEEDRNAYNKQINNNEYPETYAQRNAREQYKQAGLLRQKTIYRDPKEWEIEEEKPSDVEQTAEENEIRFSHISWLRAFTTRGRGNGQYMESYHLMVSNDGLTWTYVRDSSGSIKVYTANSDGSSLAEYMITETVITQFIRIYPQTWTWWPSFRIEVKGCAYKPASCWKAVLGTEGDSLPLVHQMTTSNHGFCGRACHRLPTCDSFKFSVSTNLCQLLGNITSVYSSTIYTDLNKKYYFAKNDVCL